MELWNLLVLEMSGSKIGWFISIDDKTQDTFQNFVAYIYASFDLQEESVRYCLW
jgi:hypothetical protein